MKRSRLEEKFGRLAPSDCAPLAAQSAVSYKRDPDERLERRIERKASQDALRERYKSEHEQARKIRALAELVLKDEFMASDRDRMSDHDKLYKSCRAEIRADDSLTLIQKQQAYMLAELSHSQTRVQLRDQVRAERTLRRELLQRLPTWREWVEKLAQGGDEAAISALRGLVYRERRSAKKIAQDGLPSDVTVCTLKPARDLQTRTRVAIARFCAERPHACSAVPVLRLPIERAIRASAATCVIISKGT